MDLEEIRRIADLKESLQASTRPTASLEQARDATSRLAEGGLDQLSAQAKALLREDWTPSVAGRRQLEINGLTQELATLESALRAEFCQSFDRDIPGFEINSRLARVRHLLESVESLKSEHEVTIETLGQPDSLTDLSAISPPQSVSSQAETIVLLSDGRHHADSVKPGDAAALWASAGAQLMTVGFGSTEPQTDLILTDTHQPRRLAPHDLISGALEIYDSMPPGQPLKVDISNEDTGDILWTDEVETSGEGARVLSFAFRITQDADELPTLLRLFARIHPVAGEARTDNNSMPMPVFLSAPPQSSMLVIDGRPRWDTRYLRNIFRRDPTWQTDVSFAPHQESLPDEDTLKSYDLIVIGEVPSEVVSDQHLTWLEEHVRSGAGVILIDGPREELRQLLNDHSLSPAAWFDAPQWLDRPHLALTHDGALEPALTLAPNKADNEAIWSYLPAPHRAIRARPKAGATILAEARSESGNTPLLITHTLGSGRVLYISSDESWRWRYQKGDEYHTRYWQQLARWIMAEPFLVHTEEVEFDLDHLRIRQRETATVRIRSKVEQEFEAVVKRDDEEVLRTSELIEGLQPGDYTVSLVGVRDTTIPLKVIEPTSIEETVTHANPHLLKRMAERGNGEFLHEHEFAELLNILKSRRAVVTKVDSITIWQSAAWLIGIVLLVAVELFFRKRAGIL